VNEKLRKIGIESDLRISKLTSQSGALETVLVGKLSKDKARKFCLETFLAGQSTGIRPASINISKVKNK